MALEGNAGEGLTGSPQAYPVHPDITMLQQKTVREVEDHERRRAQPARQSAFYSDLARPTPLRRSIICLLMAAAGWCYCTYTSAGDLLFQQNSTILNTMFMILVGAGFALGLDSLNQTKKNSDLFEESFWSHIRF